jgi:hypothetical protein
MLKKIERKMEGDQLMEARKTFFILGYTQEWMGDPKFPFESQQERRDLWNKYKTYIQKQMYAFRKHGNFRNPNWNSLRAEEYWKFDALSPRLVLNGAKRLNPEDSDNDLWNSEPLLETDFEYLSRLNLLTPDDQNFIAKYEKEFWRAEKDDIDYREYLFEIEKSEKFQLTTKVGGPDQQTVNIDGNGGKLNFTFKEKDN